MKGTAVDRARRMVSMLDHSAHRGKAEKKRIQLIAPPGSVKLKEHGKRRKLLEEKGSLVTTPFLVRKLLENKGQDVDQSLPP